MEFSQKMTDISYSIRVQGQEFKALSDAQSSRLLALELQIQDLLKSQQAATPLDNTKINVTGNKEFEYYRSLVNDNKVTTTQLCDEFRTWRKDLGALIRWFESFCAADPASNREKGVELSIYDSFNPCINAGTRPTVPTLEKRAESSPSKGPSVARQTQPLSKGKDQRNQGKKKGNGTKKGNKSKSGEGKANGPVVNASAGNGSKSDGPKKFVAQGGSSQGGQRPQSQRQPPHEKPSASSSRKVKGQGSYKKSEDSERDQGNPPAVIREALGRTMGK